MGHRSMEAEVGDRCQEDSQSRREAKKGRAEETGQTRRRQLHGIQQQVQQCGVESPNDQGCHEGGQHLNRTGREGKEHGGGTG
jgi:hypothetical protein